MGDRTASQFVETEVEPDRVVALLGDVTRVPEWAPAFADRVVEAAGGRWRATKGGQDFEVRLVMDEAAGTVDYLRVVAPGREGGAYLRTVPRPGGGSVVVMTVPVRPGDDPGEVVEVLRGELAGLVALLEGTAHR